MAVIHHQGIIDGSKVAILSSSRERERKHMLYSKSRCRLKTMAGIRVRLQFPDDEKYWIYIDHTHMRTVQDVVNSINEKFSVCCEKLLLDDAQLPWMESVSLIQERDILCVQLTSTKKKRKRDDLKPENELNNLINSIDHSYPNLKKKKSKEEKSQNKTDDIPLLENQESGQKKKKRKTFQEQSEPEVQNTPTCLQYSIPEATQLPSTSSNGGNEVVTGNSNESYVAKSKPVKEQANESLLLKNGQDHEQDNPTLDNSLNETNEEDKTKKRRRRRKRKSHHKEEPALNLQVPPAPVNYVPYQPTDRKHIRFNNGQKMEIGSSEAVEKDVEVTGSTIAEKSKPPVQLFPDDEFNPLHNDKFNTKTSSPLKSKQAATLKSNGPITMDTPKVANLPIRANPNVSPFGALLSLRSAVFTRNAKPTANPVEPSYNNVPPPGDLAAVEPPNCSKDQTIDEPVAQLESTASPQTVDVTKFPLFPGPPRVNDVIAFKILELSDNYNPEVSEYIRGRITAIQTNGEIAIELLQPRAKPHAFGKFELYQNDDEEDVEEEEVEMETSMSYQWSQLIEPRLIYP